KLTVTPAALEIEIGSDVSPAGRTRKLTVSDELGGTVVAKSINWNVPTSSWPYFLPDWLSLSRTSGGSAPAEDISVVEPSEVLAAMPNGTYTYNLSFQYTRNSPYNGYTYEVQVPVTLKINAPVSKLEVIRQSETLVAIAKGPQVSFRGKATYAHGYSEDLTTQLEWSSSDKAVASFETDAPSPGVVQPLKAGTAQIKATMTGSTQQGSYALKVDAAKSRVYVVEGDYIANARINQYVTGQDGRLQPMREARVSVSEFPQNLVFTPDGKYAYLSHYQPFEAGQYALSQFSVDANGVLSPLPASRVLLGSYAPQAMIMDKQGKHLYVLGSPAGRILRLSVGADGGLELDAKPPVDGGGQGGGLALHPTLPYLYQTGIDANMVSRFQVSEAGSLTFMPDAQQTGYRPKDVAIHPFGKALYVSNEGDYNNTGALSQYHIEDDGRLSYITAPLELSSRWGGPMAASPNGEYLFFSYSGRTSSGYQGDTEVAVLALDESGLVSFQFSYLISSLRQLALDSAGTNLYATTGHGTVLQYKVGNDGTLVMDSNIVKLTSPRAIAVLPAPAP
ncbi:MAG TPA: beta-propeller fold lactonase family protein, partial [Solimonas sp.]